MNQLFSILDDLGSCWKDLGRVLGLTEPQIHNIGEERNCNKERATAVLQMWMDREANDATVGLLADSLEKINKKRIAEKLLGT